MTTIHDRHELSDVEALCTRLDSFLMSRFDYKTSCAHSSNLNTNITAKRKKFDLYIRVFEHKEKFWGGSALILSRIGFDKTRQGHGAELLKLLVNFGQEHRYDVIGIEHGNTPSIQGFADKYGFKKVSDGNHFTARVPSLAAEF